MSNQVKRAAFSKMNLGLQVRGKRSDGFHEIRTVFQSLALHDTLTFEEADKLLLVCPNSDLPTDANNLVIKAALKLADFCSVKSPGAKIQLTKRIPVQAGMGGGSSDAAVTMLGLSKLWGLTLKPRDLLPIAVELGSDVPFFLTGGTALGIGRGEEVYPLPDCQAFSVVVIPGNEGTSTAEAYERIDKRLTERKRENKIIPIIEGLVEGSFIGEDLFNDFEEVQTRNTSWNSSMQRLLTPEKYARLLMAGSGSAWLILFKEGETARKALEKIRKTEPGAILTKTLTRHDYWEHTQLERE